MASNLILRVGENETVSFTVLEPALKMYSFLYRHFIKTNYSHMVGFVDSSLEIVGFEYDTHYEILGFCRVVPEALSFWDAVQWDIPEACRPHNTY